MIRIEPEAYKDDRIWVQAAIMMIEDGFSGSQTACQLGVHCSTLHLALKPSGRRDVRHRESYPECSRCGQHLTTNPRRSNPLCKLCEIRHARRHDQTIIELWEAGMQGPEIAKALGDMRAKEVNNRITRMRERGIKVSLRAVGEAIGERGRFRS